MRQTEKQIRFKTAAWRRLPDFIIIGTQKGGTTSLFDYLCRHPRVKSPFRKEVHFFDKYYVHGLDWYRGFFPLKNGRGTLTGEASPYYMYFPLAARRVAELLPDVKLIAMLRDPVERAYSHYKFYERRDMEPAGSFREAIALEPSRLAGEKEKVLANPKYRSEALQHYSYLDRGKYVDQINHWLQFFPREQFLFLKSEDFFADPQEVLDRTCAFLGLPEFRPENMPVKNAGSYRSLDEALTKELQAYYQESVDELSTLLGPEFKWW